MTDTICNFFPEHIDYLNAPESSKQGILTNYGLKNFVFMSIIKSKKLLGVLGCRFLNNNTCELYAIPDVVYSKKYNKTFHKSTLSIIKRLMTKSTFNRFQFLVDVDFNEGQRWAKALGFEYEATLKKYDEKGKDQFMYVRFK